MNCSKIRNVGHEELVEIFHKTLAERNLTCDDLVELLHYPIKSKGKAEIDKLFKGEDSRAIRDKIGHVLNIDHERLHGERVFESRDEKLRFEFKPYLLRVAENRSPDNGITILGLAGTDWLFVVGKYEQLFGMPREEQLLFIKQQCLADEKFKELKGRLPFFGLHKGYAFKYDYDEPAISLSLLGDVREDVESTPYTSNSSVVFKNKTIKEMHHETCGTVD